MNRLARSHRSTKIPNVKLRPASRASDEANSSKLQSNRRAKLRDTLRDGDEDDEHFRCLRDSGVDHGAHVDADFIGSSARPLKGAVISITGLGDAKLSLTNYATELGAKVEANLTEDVTHLIADRPGSQKYRFALQLGMHILQPEWIVQLRHRWLQGEDVDAEQLQHQFLLNALANTTLCFAGLPRSERHTLAALATQLGANVSDELRFDGTITHLVSGTADLAASSSIHYILHFLNRATQGRSGSREEAAANIALVRPEWLQDCHLAAGCLDEKIYSIFADLPTDDVRKQLVKKATNKVATPFVRQPAPLSIQRPGPFSTATKERPSMVESSSSRKRGSLQSIYLVNPSNDTQNADEDEEEPITLGSRQKAAAAAAKSLDSILMQLRTGSNLASSTEATSCFPSSPAASAFTMPRNRLLSMSRTSSFSPAPSSIVAPMPKRKRSNGFVSLPHLTMPRSAQKGACFAGCSFKVQLDDPQKTSVLETVLKHHGGSVLPTQDPTVPHYVVVDTRHYQPAKHSDVEAMPVIHFWIEYCLYHECFFDPSTYFASAPAHVHMPLAQGGRLKAILLGLQKDSPESYHARKLVEELGGTVVEQMKGESVTHVICATKESYEGRRAQRARSYGAPVVDLRFLIEARRTGRLVPPPIPLAILEERMSSESSSAVTERLPPIAHLDLAPPLARCTISRTKAVSSQTTTLERKALQLGGCFQAQCSDATTHLLHQGSSLPREFKEAHRNIFLVHPSWLDKCLEEGLRVDESLFPSSMNPSKSLATILSSSDGSISGNLLSQASELLQPPMHAGVVAAAKPWHRSFSADAASLHHHAYIQDVVDHIDAGKQTGQPDRQARGHSEDPNARPTMDVEEDADATLQAADEESNEDEAVAPRSPTLFEAEEQRPPSSPASKLKESTEKMASADQVMALLRSRALDQGGKKKSRLPPRFRKQRSDELRYSHSPTPSTMANEGMVLPEKVLELQAIRDAERAAEAVAHGYSLGLEKDVRLPSNSQNITGFDASIRIVYDDPAARRERNRLIKILPKHATPPCPDAEQASVGQVRRQQDARRVPKPRSG